MAPPAAAVAGAGRTGAATRRWLAGAAAVLLAGCASVPAPVAISGGESFSGRLALRVEPWGNESARAFSAAFDLRGDPRAGTLGLSTPLGSRLAEARWSAAEVVLVTPQSTRRFTDLDGLTREVLGESVPIEAWFDWLHGRPWTGAPSTPTATPGFEQMGWTVDLARFDDGAVMARRTAPMPVVAVRIQLDRS